MERDAGDGGVVFAAVGSVASDGCATCREGTADFGDGVVAAVGGGFVGGVGNVLLTSA